LASSFAITADAATKKPDPAMVAKEKNCKAEANKMFTALHPLKRRAHVKECMAKP
jgi:hypothetical protein